jgi:Fe-S cluster assembly protein SufD
MTDLSTDWLGGQRARALDALSEVEMPAFRGVAGWEFTPIDALDLDAFPQARGRETAAGQGVSGALEGALTPQDAEPAAEGPIVMPLSAAAERLPDVVGRHLGTVVTAVTPFTVRNAAHWTDGTLVYVPRNVRVEAPIVTGTVHERSGSTLHWRTLVVLEEGAEAEVWDQTVSGSPETEGVVNGVVELVLGANAQLRYVGVQDINERTWVFGSERATVGRDATLDWVTLGFGGANGKVFLETQLAEPGSQARVTGAYATQGRQHVDFDTLQEHAAPDTTSDLAYRGILSGRSSAVWRGMIKVDPGAQRTDAFQECRNLLLTK